MMAGSTKGEPRQQELEHGRRHALETLLAYDRNIRCVVEVGLDGQQIASACRKRLESLEPDRETMRVFEQTAVGAGMGSSLNGYHGRVRVVIVARERLSLIVFPLFDSLILVSADPDFPLQKTRRMAKLLDTIFPGDLEPKEADAAPSWVPTFRELRANVL